MSQFTWWRRFYPTQKLDRTQYFKGGSKLLQQIEFGEFEQDPLGAETYLEEEIYRLKCAEIDAMQGYHHDTLEELKVQERQKKNKRIKIMMETHLENEHNRLIALQDELAKEFHINVDMVIEIMETFDGTTRDLYFYIKAIVENRPLKSFEEIQLIPRMQHQQPRHILKPKERKLAPHWKKIVQNKSLW
jgi:hypothetical protein